MMKYISQNRIGAAGVLACLILGGFEFFEAYLGGVSRLDLNTPLGALAGALAGLFSGSHASFAFDVNQQVLAYHFLWSSRLLSTLLFAVLYYLLSRRLSSRLSSRSSLSSLQIHWIFSVQLLIGLVGLSSLLCVLAAEFCLLVGWRKGWPWLVAQMSLYAVLHFYYLFGRGSAYSQDTVAVALFYLFAQLLFYAIFFLAMLLWTRSHSRSLALNSAHAELLATQAMLADTVRASERLRISRDLHDVIGHHLTALNLHLDLAQRQASGVTSSDLQNSLTISRDLASGLLSEIRAIVSIERQQQNFDLTYALETLCAGIPQPAIDLEIDKSLEINSALLAHTLFCCVQEAITNCVRHASASILRISLRPTEHSIMVMIEDNGTGRHTDVENSGLCGMRERIEHLHGQLNLAHSTDGGFKITITIPVKEWKDMT